MEERAPEHEDSLVGAEPRTTSWDIARERLANPEDQRTNWLATVRPDGQPHLMPVIAFWIDGAFTLWQAMGRAKRATLRPTVGASSGQVAQRFHRSM